MALPVSRTVWIIYDTRQNKVFPVTSKGPGVGAARVGGYGHGHGEGHSQVASHLVVNRVIHASREFPELSLRLAFAGGAVNSNQRGFVLRLRGLVELYRSNKGSFVPQCAGSSV